jgi:predicted nuclease with TOPRIM domain
MLIASLSLVAFPFMTGFYSKDFILESAYGQYYFSGIVVYFIATIGAMFTTLYSIKVLYLTFLTNPNGSKINYKIIQYPGEEYGIERFDGNSEYKNKVDILSDKFDKLADDKLEVDESGDDKLADDKLEVDKLDDELYKLADEFIKLAYKVDLLLQKLVGGFEKFAGKVDKFADKLSHEINEFIEDGELYWDYYKLVDEFYKSRDKLYKLTHETDKLSDKVEKLADEVDKLLDKLANDKLTEAGKLVEAHKLADEINKLADQFYKLADVLNKLYDKFTEDKNYDYLHHIHHILYDEYTTLADDLYILTKEFNKLADDNLAGKVYILADGNEYFSGNLISEYNNLFTEFFKLIPKINGWVDEKDRLPVKLETLTGGKDRLADEFYKLAHEVKKLADDKLVDDKLAGDKLAHEGNIFMTLPLIILAFFSIFFGYMTKDIFIGLGSGFFADNSIFIHPRHEIMLDTEFAVPTFFKLLPFIFTISLSIIAIVLSEFVFFQNILIKFKLSRLGYNIFGFFNQRFLIEMFYNKYVTNRVLELGGQTTKVLDKGSVEFIGGYGWQKSFSKLSGNIDNLNTGLINNYALFILIGFILLLLIAYIDLKNMDLVLLFIFLCFTILGYYNKPSIQNSLINTKAINSASINEKNNIFSNRRTFSTYFKTNNICSNKGLYST